MTFIMYLFDWYREAWVISFDVMFCLFGWIVYELDTFSLEDVADMCTHFLIGRFYLDPFPTLGVDFEFDFWISGYRQPWIYENDNYMDLPF